ncbi:hypothetical protein BT69DRAFT_1344780 [Atractiella rhizophila]|nr:hypothetical protein BT69DRAFT_1344780 [Atractiella rhizophila]
MTIGHRRKVSGLKPDVIEALAAVQQWSGLRRKMVTEKRVANGKSWNTSADTIDRTHATAMRCEGSSTVPDNHERGSAQNAALLSCAALKRKRDDMLNKNGGGG